MIVDYDMKIVDCNVIIVDCNMIVDCDDSYVEVGQLRHQPAAAASRAIQSMLTLA